MRFELHEEKVVRGAYAGEAPGRWRTGWRTFGGLRLSGRVWTISTMAQNVIACDRERELLLPPSLRDWLPGDHLAWFVLAAVEEMDLAAFYAAYRDDGRGRAAHEPAMMVALLACAYATGRRSSRAIERGLLDNVAARVVAARSRVFASATRRRWRACSVRCSRCALPQDERRPSGFTQQPPWNSITPVRRCLRAEAEAR